MDELKQTLSDKRDEFASDIIADATETDAEPSSNRPVTKPLSNPVKDEPFFAWSVFNRDLNHLEFFNRVLEENEIRSHAGLPGATKIAEEF